MLKHKKIKLITRMLFIILITAKIGLSQSVNVTPMITPPYPIHLEDIISFDYGIIVTLNNFSNQSESLKLIASLEGDNGVSVIIKDSYIPSMPIQLGPNGTVVLTQGDLQRLFSNITNNNVEYSGIDETILLQTEKLPEGVYQLCIKALDYNTSELKSIETSGCTSFYVTDYDPPIITSPIHDEYVNPINPQAIMFTWVSTGLPQYTRYKIEIVDMTLNNLLDPNDAFGNLSIILHYQKQDILQTNLFYDASMPNLLENHEYALRITASDPTQTISFKNNGQSEVISFKYQKQKSIDTNSDLDIDVGNNGPLFAQNSCNTLTPPADQTAIKDVNEYDVLKIGSHDLKVFDISWSGNKLSGEGKIINSYFKVPILVEFSDLKINAAHKVFEGIVTARADNNVPSEWINELGDVDFQGGDITNVIGDLIGDNDDRTIEYPYSNLDSVGLGMPIGINRKIAGTDQLLAIVGMTFSPYGAGLNAIGEFEIPKYDKSIKVGASGVCFDNTGFTKDAFLYLIEELSLNENGKFKIKLDKGVISDPPQGTYITMESEGFKEAQLAGEFQIDESLIMPVDDDLDQVIITFDALVENPKNFIIDNIDVTPFEITKFPGFEVTVSDVSFDLSDTQNPDNIEFPTDDYNGNEGNMWQGFYMGTCDIKLPEKLQKDVAVQASNFVIDKKGFSGIIESPLVFDTEQGKLGTRKWKWSMENLYVEVLENNLNSAKFEGEVRVPITKDNFYMSYESNISVDGDNLLYNFTIINEEEVFFPAIIAKGEISPQTRIEIKNGENGFEPEFHLFGNLTLNKSLNFNKDKDGLLPSLSLDSIIVEDVIVDGNGLSLGPDGAVSFSYDADQRTFNGFDINIDTVLFSSNKINIALGVDLLGETSAVAASGSFDINLGYDDNDNMMHFEGVTLNQLTVEGDISVASVYGFIKFNNDDPTWGTGFEGKLEIGLRLGADPDEKIGSGSIEKNDQENDNAGVKIHTIFGKIPAKGPVDAYKYFYFNGEFFLKKGIPLTATLNLYGLKGGIFLNMKQKKGADIFSIPEPFKATNNDLNMGLMAGIDIGLKDANAFHAKPKLMVEFSTQTGLKKIIITGEAYVMTEWQSTFKPYAEGTTPVAIGMDANLDFEDKIFNLKGSFAVAYPLQTDNPLISASGSVSMFVDHKPGIWRIMAGVPTAIQEQNASADIGVNIANLFKKQHYFMAGTGLPKRLPIPQEIIDNLPKPYITNQNGIENSDNLKFAFGSQFNFDSERLKAWIFYAEFKILFGYDVMLTKDFNSACGIGKNHWYMRGQAYGQFKADIGVEAKIFGKIRSAKICYVNVSALVEVGLARPAGISAVVKGEGSFMGIINGDFEFEAEQGEICEEEINDTDIPFDDLVYIQDCSAKGNKVSVFHDPEVSLLFKASNNNTYPLKQIVNEKEVTRYFKFPLKSAKLTINDSNSEDNGLVIADYGKSGFQGSFELQKSGDVLSFTSLKTLPGSTKMKLEVSVEVYEDTNGTWELITDISESATKKTFSFTTKAKPTEIVEENIQLKYPADGQRYYLQDERSKVAFINLDDYQGELFEFDEEHPGEVKVRFIPVGKGANIKGSFINYDVKTNTVYFKHERLATNKKYVCQIYRKLKGGGHGDTNFPEAAGDFKSKMTAKFKLLNSMKYTQKETKIYEFVFGVSKYMTLPQKLDKMQISKSSWISTTHDGEGSHTNMQYIAAEEGFDEADKIHLNAKWLVTDKPVYLNKFGKDSGHTYYKDYLKPVIYDFFNNDLRPHLNNHSKLEVEEKINFYNVEPLISQNEINSILKNPLNPGFQLADAPGTKKVSFQINGLTVAHQHFNKVRNLVYDPDFQIEIMNKKIPLAVKLVEWYKANKKFQSIKTNKDYHMILMRKNIDSGLYQYKKSWKAFNHITYG